MPCTLSVWQRETPKKERPATPFLHHRWGEKGTYGQTGNQQPQKEKGN